MSIAPVFVDAHVHLHEHVEPGAFLDTAWENARQAAGTPARPPATVVLLLAQVAGNDRFERLAAAAGSDESAALRAGLWTLRRTGEVESLTARRADGARIVLVCGRQVRSAEGLEVLALATCRGFEDGRPIAIVLAEAAGCGALAVLPWGVGKWLGRRGRIVEELLRAGSRQFVCGDNANRPVFWPTPRLLRLAGRLGVRVLPGSDTLPFPGAGTSAGRFGFTIGGTLSPDTPAANLLEWLTDTGRAIAAHGRRDSPWRFLRNQVLLRVRPSGPREGQFG